MPRYAYRPFAYRRAPELSGTGRGEAPLVIVGAGPVGLTLAIDLALKGVASLVLDDNDVVSLGSRAICWSKRTLEIYDRLGLGEKLLAKGVTWKVGRLYHGEREVFCFDLLPEPGHKMPAFINLQQYYLEEYLADRAGDFPELIDLRWKNRVAEVRADETGAELTVETPDGGYRLHADWLIACDGSRSGVRAALGLDFAGRVFEERFLICDVEMEADFPSERRFWFDPPFHQGQSALLHKQPENIYRIDLQLGPDADPEAEKAPHRVMPRIKAMVGDRPFQIDWVSVYTFQCRRMERFVHGRVVFAGDAAHIVSPFGARGGNGGIQDADNLAWKLALVLAGEAPESLIESYDEERVPAADENILNSSRSTSFMTPKSPAEAWFRKAVLDLAGDEPFARRLINSGRLSTPHHYRASRLCGEDAFPAGIAPQLAPGAPPLDAPLGQEGQGFLVERLGGDFCLVRFGKDPSDGFAASCKAAGLRGLPVTSAEARSRYGAQEEAAVYLFRPDQHVAARWPERAFSRERAEAAVRQAKGLG
ncbi:FAD-dependent oxidoreductase [Afifella pfennigii]|uniref:FAD-dependent oxidoreductase n=1 Tax=Afifella pfennigii TaxID=209897 RepID=UPI00047C4B7A|nr:FAD-dependent oxidoreductase [Afifella pfennigii]